MPPWRRPVNTRNARMTAMAKVAGWAKLGAALLLTGVLGAGAAVVALKTFFPEPKLRAMVLDGARKQLGRDVKLERIALGLRGLRLEGLQISESPDFAAGTFVSVESFRARPSWRALLRKKLVVATVEASGLKVSVVKRADGVFNFSNLASSAPAAATPAAPAQDERPEFSIRHVRVSRGSVLYKDEATKESWELSEVALSADDLGLLAPFDVDASLRARGARGGRPVDARLAFDGVIDPARGDPAKLKVKARKFSVESEGLAVKGSADVDGLAPPQARFNAEVSAAGKTLVEASGEVRLSSAAGGDFLADVTAESAGLDTTALAKGQYPFLKLPPELSLPSAKVQGAVTLAGDSAKLEDLKVTVPQGTVSVSGSVARLGSAKPAPDVTVTLALSLPAVKAGELPVALPPSVPAGFVIPVVKVDGALALKGDDARFKALRLVFSGGKVVLGGAVLGALSAKPRPELEVQAELALPALTDKDLPLAGVPAGLQLPPTSWEADLDYTLERLRVRKLHLKLGGNDVAVEGTIGDPAGRMAYDLLVKCKSFVLEELTKLTPAPAPPAVRSRGTFNVGALAHTQARLTNVKLSWDLSGVSPNLRLLNGNARLSAAEGRLRGAKEIAASNPALKALMTPVVIIMGLGRFVAGIPDLSDIAVRAIAGDYLFKDGVMHVRSSQLDSDKVQASAVGSVDLPHEALDLLVTAQVGRVLPTDIEVRGTVSDPKVKPKVGKLLGDMLKTGVQGLLQLPAKSDEQ